MLRVLEIVLFLPLLLGACADAPPDRPPDPAVVDAIVFEAPDGVLYVDAVALDEAFARGDVRPEIAAAARMDLGPSERLLLAVYLNEYGDGGMLEALRPWACARDAEALDALNRVVAGYTAYAYAC